MNGMDRTEVLDLVDARLGPGLLHLGQCLSGFPINFDHEKKGILV